MTFVIVQKRHHTRLFANNHKDRSSIDKSGNILPGTIWSCHNETEKLWKLFLYFYKGWILQVLWWILRFAILLNLTFTSVVMLESRLGFLSKKVVPWYLLYHGTFVNLLARGILTQHSYHPTGNQQASSLSCALGWEQFHRWWNAVLDKQFVLYVKSFCLII